MIISDFINEIGNKIKIKIQKNTDFVINYKTKEKIKFNGVKISIIGPTSDTTNEITLEEAIQLHKCLGEYLKKFK
uniref:Uncharacterized protein n=1 Tax=viral metagenome TaxID=1070528 RepID=A0A6C0BBU1_9ZZZZ